MGVKLLSDTGPQSAVGNVSDCRARVVSSIQSRSHAFMQIDHEIISTIILIPSLIQEGLLSVTSEIMCMKSWLTMTSLETD